MDKIPLSEMVAELRRELLKAQEEGKDAALRFLIEDVELEVQVGTTKEADGGGGVKFWVYNAEAKVSASDATTQAACSPGRAFSWRMSAMPLPSRRIAAAPTSW